MKAGSICTALAILALTASPLTPSARAEFVQMLGAEFAASGRFYSVDVTSAALTTLGNTNDFLAGMDFSPSGVLYAASTTLKEVDPASGRASNVRNINFMGGPGFDILTGLTFSSAGDLYGIGNGNGNLWRIDLMTANAQFIGTAAQPLFALEFGPDDRLLGAGFDLWEIDPATAAATRIGAIAGSALITGLDYAPDGLLYGADSNITTDSLYAIDIASGRGTLLGRTGGNLVSLASVPQAPVPEPTTFTLSSVGALGLMGYAWRRGRSKTAA